MTQTTGGADTGSDGGKDSTGTTKKMLRDLSTGTSVRAAAEPAKTAHTMAQRSGKNNASSLSAGGEEEKKTSLHRRVNSLGLSGGIESSVACLMENNPKHVNRLSGLFKELTKKGIDVDDRIVSLVSKNIGFINPFVNLVNFMYSKNIDFNSVRTELLFEAAPHAENLINGLNALSESNVLSLAVFKLMLSYPEHALPLSQLLIDLDSYSFSGELMGTKLSQFSKEAAGSAFDLLNFALERSIFYPDLIDIILKHEKHIDTILEGAKKLQEDKTLSTVYFDMANKNPENAINIAKNLLILKGSSLLNLTNKQSLEAIQDFGAGEFMFFKILKRSGSLDAQMYADICHHHSIFAREDVQDALNHVPLFASFNQVELNTLSAIITRSNSPTIEEINRFLNVIECHHLMPVEHVSPGRSGGPN